MKTYVKGFVEIPKNPEENEVFYKQRISYLLYCLLANYRAVPREVGLYAEDEWDSLGIRAIGYEQPSEDTTEQDILQDKHKESAFTDYHATHGWNKLLRPDDKLIHVEMQHDAYTTDEDYIHWVRKEQDERRNLNVCLVKYCDYETLGHNGCSTLNGILFAEQATKEIYAKIKRVIERFTTILSERKIAHTTTIQQFFTTEHLRHNPETQKLEWIVEELKIPDGF